MVSQLLGLGRAVFRYEYLDALAGIYPAFIHGASVDRAQARALQRKWNFFYRVSWTLISVSRSPPGAAAKVVRVIEILSGERT
jgi:hypothetical protein